MVYIVLTIHFPNKNKLAKNTTEDQEHSKGCGLHILHKKHISIIGLWAISLCFGDPSSFCGGTTLRWYVSCILCEHTTP